MGPKAPAVDIMPRAKFAVSLGAGNCNCVTTIARSVTLQCSPDANYLIRCDSDR